MSGSCSPLETLGGNVELRHLVVAEGIARRLATVRHLLRGEQFTLSRDRCEQGDMMRLNKMDAVATFPLTLSQVQTLLGSIETSLVAELALLGIRA